jgi:hypothetical protein
VVFIVIGYQHKTVKVSCISYVEILYNYEDYSVGNSTQNVTVIVIYDFIIYSRNNRLGIYSNYDILTKKGITGVAIYRNYDMQSVLSTKGMLHYNIIINSNYFILDFLYVDKLTLVFQFKQLYSILLSLVITY